MPRLIPPQPSPTPRTTAQCHAGRPLPVSAGNQERKNQGGFFPLEAWRKMGGAAGLPRPAKRRSPVDVHGIWDSPAIKRIRQAIVQSPLLNESNCSGRGVQRDFCQGKYRPLPPETETRHAVQNNDPYTVGKASGTEMRFRMLIERCGSNRFPELITREKRMSRYSGISYDSAWSGKATSL